MSLRPCLERGCPVLVPSGRCPAHTRRHERPRDQGPRPDRLTTHRRLLGSERWRQLSRSWLAQHALCGERADGRRYAEHSRCTRAGRLVPADCVDHIWPVSKGGSHWAAANLQSLCVPCNSAKGDRRSGSSGVAAGDEPAPVLA